MRKIFFLLFFFPALLFAKFHSGTIQFNDGTSKTGFIETPEADNSKLKFRPEENGKTEKFSIDIVQSFDIINDENIKVHYVTLQTATVGLFNHDKINIDKNKSWLRVIKEGKICVYSGYYFNNNESGFIYYIKREKDNYCLYLIMGSSGGFEIPINVFSTIKTTLKEYFKNDCPKLFELLNKDDMKKEGLGLIVDLYDKNCGK